MRVMKLTDEVYKIHPGTNIAQASSVIEVQTVKAKTPHKTMFLVI